jgi:hypothetical protein
MLRSRSIRAIAGFDIAAIAPATLAITVLLVLILILSRTAVDRAQIERATAAAESERHRLASDVAQLSERNRQRWHAEAGDAGPLTRLRVRVRGLEAERARLLALRQESSTPPALLMAFSSHCEVPARVDFYVHGEGVRFADGSEWGEVLQGDQPVPQGVIALHEESAAVLANLFQPSAELLGAFVARSLERALSLWILPTVPAAARFGLFAKAGPETQGCTVTSQVLAVGAMPAEGRAVSVRFAGEVRKHAQIVLLGRVAFDGKVLIPLPPAAGEQEALDRRFLPRD